MEYVDDKTKWKNNNELEESEKDKHPAIDNSIITSDK